MLENLVNRVAALDWASLTKELDERGAVTTGSLLSMHECAELRRLYGAPHQFRSKVIMARHGFGQGEYQYFAYPLPQPVADLRGAFYPRLAPLANQWAQRLGEERRFPDAHESFLEECHQAGQVRPTPLMLRYGPSDYNCLHQDLYGDIAFPFQVVFLLSAPGADFTGGELVLTEQRPRMQSRVHVIPLQVGAAAIFAVRHRPVQGTRGTYRTALRHGVSQVLSGERMTLGLIFHDAL